MKKKVLEEMNIFNTFVFLYIYSRVAYSYLNQFSNRVKLMRKVLLVPTKMRVSPCLLPGEVKWFIGGYRRQEAEQFLSVLSNDLSLLFITVSVCVSGHEVFFNHKNGENYPV